jgi:septal ring factor EnvC (AmiA/AmiB activator)
MATPDPVVSAINRLEERLERLETEIADVKASIERLEAQLAREGADRQDLRGQIVEFRRRLGELEGRVQDRRGLRPDERAEAFSLQTYAGLLGHRAGSADRVVDRDELVAQSSHL